MSKEQKKLKEKISQKINEAKSGMTPAQFERCKKDIHTASVAAAAAGAIPIPVADAIPISGAQVAMAIALGKVFDRTLTESAAKALVGAAASTLVGRSLVKLIPVAGWIASAAVAGLVTEAIGWSLAVDFSNDHIPNVKCHEKDSTEEPDISPSVDSDQDETDSPSGVENEEDVNDESFGKDINAMFEEDNK